jgi:hypothetical protein
MAALWRKNQGLEIGIPLKINCHPWFKWIDSEIEQEHIKEVLDHMRMLYKQ